MGRADFWLLPLNFAQKNFSSHKPSWLGTASLFLVVPMQIRG